MENFYHRMTYVIAALLAAGLVSTGCGTASARLDHDRNRPNTKLIPYPGVIYDTAGIVQTPVRIAKRPGQLFLLPFYAADIPFSAAVDTALLPLDIEAIVK